MRGCFVAAGWIGVLGLAALLVRPAGAQEPARPESVRAVEEDYEKRLLELDRRRVELLAELAGRQKPAEAAATYEHLFRLAIAGNLFKEAEPAAAAVLKRGTPSPAAYALACLVKVLGEADRGAYDASLATLRAALDDAPGAREKRPALLTSEAVSLCDAYYQRLMQADQFAVAREALRYGIEKVSDPALKVFLAGRLKRVELVGKPAPAVRGKDVDGKAFDLAGEKGKVVLVVFWATWATPSAEEVEWLKETSKAYRPRGFRVVGVNVDALRSGADAATADVRQFLLDHNVTWPTLMNGEGNDDYAAAYGVTDIPANVLVAKDGTVAHLDLVRDRLDDAVEKELGK